LRLVILVTRRLPLAWSILLTLVVGTTLWILPCLVVLVFTRCLLGTGKIRVLVPGFQHLLLRDVAFDFGDWRPLWLVVPPSGTPSGKTLSSGAPGRTAGRSLTSSTASPCIAFPGALS